MEMRSSMQSSASVGFLSIARIKIYCTNWSTHQAIFIASGDVFHMYLADSAFQSWSAQ